MSSPLPTSPEITGRDETSVSGPAILEVESVTKKYGEVTALDRVSLGINNGEFLTLLGPSGSGKTTLLNAIAGFETIEEGDLRFQGESLLRVAPEDRDFGFVFQSYALFPHMSIRENVAYPLRLRGMKKNQRDKVVMETLDLVELGHLAERFPTQLSGGQQQRVAVARALAFEPRVLLMDEPLSALDRKLRTSLQFELKKLQKRLALTVVFVTHDQEEALTMSDRIAVMDAGQIVQIGPPMELYTNPSSLFVADFLGENNFLSVSEVTTAAGATHARLEDLDATILVTPSRIHIDPRAAEATVAIRPEDISIGVDQDQDADPASSQSIPATLTSRAFLGEGWRYECTLESGKVVVVRLPKSQMLESGTASVNLNFDPERATLLLPETT